MEGVGGAWSVKHLPFLVAHCTCRSSATINRVMSLLAHL